MRTISAQLKWQSVSNTPELEVWELWNDQIMLLLLTVNHSDQTARIESDSSRRYFHIEKEGLLLNRKTIVKNE